MDDSYLIAQLSKDQTCFNSLEEAVKASAQRDLARVNRDDPSYTFKIQRRQMGIQLSSG
jgi:hypothetical protein